MICDTLQHLTRYKGLCKNLDTAIDYLLTHDPASLPLGRTEVDGEEVFINTMDATLHSDDGYHPEYHKKYADLQLDITGSEGWGLYHKSRQGDRRFYRRLRFSGQRQCRDRHTGRRTLCAVLPHGAAQTRPCTARLCGRAQGCCKDSDGGLNDG